PALADVAVQRQRLVLRQHKDPPQLRVNTIREGDIDDSVDAAEMHGWLGAVSGKRIQPLALTTGQQANQRVARDRMDAHVRTRDESAFAGDWVVPDWKRSSYYSI